MTVLVSVHEKRCMNEKRKRKWDGGESRGENASGRAATPGIVAVL